MKRFLFFLCLFFSQFHSFSQQVAKTIPSSQAPEGLIGFLEFRPANYGTVKDPLIIFLHGAGEVGNGTTTINKVATNAIPRFCANGATMKFTVNGQTSSFIVLSPQLSSSLGAWPSYYVQQMIDYAKANLQVDTTRIYVTGLSLGGGGCWTYAFDSLKNSQTIAALAPVCGTDYGNDPNACATAGASHLPIWAFHSMDDGTVGVGNTQHVQLTFEFGCSSYTPFPRFTYYKTGDHAGAWINAYDTGHITRLVDSSQVKNGASTSVNFTANPNLYEWLLLQRRAPSSLPITISSFNYQINSNTITFIWTTQAESNVSKFTLFGSVDGVKWDSVAAVKSKYVNGTGPGTSYTLTYTDPWTSVTTKAGFGVVMFFLIFGILIFDSRTRKSWITGTVSLVMGLVVLVTINCTKVDSTSSETVKYKQFKLVETDLDNSVQYSSPIVYPFR